MAAPRARRIKASATTTPGCTPVRPCALCPQMFDDRFFGTEGVNPFFVVGIFDAPPRRRCIPPRTVGHGKLLLGLRGPGTEADSATLYQVSRGAQTWDWNHGKFRKSKKSSSACFCFRPLGVPTLLQSGKETHNDAAVIMVSHAHTTETLKTKHVKVVEIGACCLSLARLKCGQSASSTCSSKNVTLGCCCKESSKKKWRREDGLQRASLLLLPLFRSRSSHVLTRG